jgi:hypothetical protein
VAFEFRPAKREDVDLIVGLAGGTGSGKTFSGMRLCAGIAGADPFAVIDTENGRALHYADFFRFDHTYLRPPFTPERYADAIQAAATAGYKAALVDSMSHEWAGEGGVLEMQEEEFTRLGGDDKKKLLSWIKPKTEHKRMVQRLLQIHPMHLVLCFRAESKIDMVKEGNRTVVKEKEGLTGIKGWFPVCEKNLPFELTVSLLLLQEQPGIPVPIKLQEQHKHLFPLDQVITEASGAAAAAWAGGGQVDWVARVEATKNITELRAIRRQLDVVKATLPATARDMAVAAFNHKLETFKHSQESSK